MSALIADVKAAFTCQTTGGCGRPLRAALCFPQAAFKHAQSPNMIGSLYIPNCRWLLKVALAVREQLSNMHNHKICSAAFRCRTASGCRRPLKVAFRFPQLSNMHDHKIWSAAFRCRTGSGCRRLFKAAFRFPQVSNTHNHRFHGASAQKTV